MLNKRRTLNQIARFTLALCVILSTMGVRIPASFAAPHLRAATITFPTTLNFGTGSDATRDLAVADMDSDQHLDLVVLNQYQESGEYVNQGAGTLAGTLQTLTTAVAIHSTAPRTPAAARSQGTWT